MRVFSFFAESVLHKRARVLKTTKKLAEGVGFFGAFIPMQKVHHFFKNTPGRKRILANCFQFAVKKGM